MTLGYEYPHAIYRLPRLLFLDADSNLEGQFYKYLTHVLHLNDHHINLRQGGKSFLFIKTCFAVFLMHFESYMADFPKFPVISIFLKVAKHYNWDASLVKNDFEGRCNETNLECSRRVEG
jgi:hypothetical protein